MKRATAKNVQVTPDLLTIKADFGVFRMTATISEPDASGLEWVDVRLEGVDLSRVSPAPGGEYMGIALGHRSGTDGVGLHPDGDDWVGREYLGKMQRFLDGTGRDDFSVYYYGRRQG